MLSKKPFLMFLVIVIFVMLPTLACQLPGYVSKSEFEQAQATITDLNKTVTETTASLEAKDKALGEVQAQVKAAQDKATAQEKALAEALQQLAQQQTAAETQAQTQAQLEQDLAEAEQQNQAFQTLLCKDSFEDMMSWGVWDVDGNYSDEETDFVGYDVFNFNLLNSQYTQPGNEWDENLGGTLLGNTYKKDTLAITLDSAKTCLYLNPDVYPDIAK